MGILAICDRDESYVRCFAEYFSGKERMPFSIHGFSKERELLEFVKKSKIEILLISEKMLSEKVRTADIDRIIVLSDGGVLCEDSPVCGYDTIFKFQSTENIIREVMEIYSESYAMVASNNIADMTKSEILGVYSPVSRCGKTTFAVTLGQILARCEQALYIGMDEFSGFETLCGRKFSGDLSDVLYYHRLNPSGLNVKIRAVIHNIRGLDIVAPMSFSGDLRDISFAQWEELISYISHKCGYDKIILDINSAVKNPIELLTLCDRVYMPVANDMISSTKIREFEHFLIQNEKEQILFNIQKVKLPQLKESFIQPGYIEQLTISKMGEFVEKLLGGGDIDGNRESAPAGYITDRTTD